MKHPAKILHLSDQHNKRLLLTHDRKTELLYLDHIITLEGQGNYTRFHIYRMPEILTCCGLGTYESILTPHGFIRINQSQIINLEHLTEYTHHKVIHLKLSNGQGATVATRRAAEFLRCLYSSMKPTPALQSVY